MSFRARSLVLTALTGLAAGALALAPAAAAGQTNCELVSSRNLRNIETGAGPVVYISRPRFICDDGSRINADSAEVFTNRNLSQFYGSVEFEDSTTVLDTDRADFFSLEGRLHARGNVTLRDLTDGSTITGDTLLYLRPTESREQAQITVTGRRPHARLYPAPAEADSVDAPDGGEGAEAAPDETSGDAPEPFVARGRQADSTATPEPFVARGAQGDSAVADSVAPADSVPADTAEVVADTLTQEPDTATQVADTAGLPPDTAAVEPDTVAAPDTSPPDSMAAEPDSTLLVPDSIPVEPDTTVVASDSSAVVPDSSGLAPDSALASVDTTDLAADTVSVEPEDTVRTPWDVDADRIFLEGSRYFRATGSVEIRRDSMEAFADSVVYDQRAGRLFLNSSAQMLGGSFELLGRDIVMVLPGDEPREIIAGPEAFLVGQGLEVEAPRIHLFMEEGAVHRMVAIMARDTSSSTGSAAERMARAPAGGDTPRGRRTVRGRRGVPLSVPGDSTPEATAQGEPEPAARDTAARDAATPAQPRAVAEDFVLTGDSIEALTPNQELERVLAAGAARGVSTGRDSLNSAETPDVARNDWLQGDTIMAYFVPDTVADDTPGDSGASDGAPGAEGGSQGRGTRIDRIVAVGSATSLYRLPSRSNTPADSTEQSDSARAEQDPPPRQRIALHFVQGDMITIHLEGQEVSEMEVEGQTRGLYLEPRPRRPPPGIQARPSPADSAGTRSTAPAADPGPGSRSGGRR